MVHVTSCELCSRVLVVHDCWVILALGIFYTNLGPESWNSKNSNVVQVSRFNFIDFCNLKKGGRCSVMQKLFMTAFDASWCFAIYFDLSWTRDKCHISDAAFLELRPFWNAAKSHLNRGRHLSGGRRDRHASISHQRSRFMTDFGSTRGPKAASSKFCTMTMTLSLKTTF